MSDPFYRTEPYQQARRKAEADLADWQEQYYDARVRKENFIVRLILCVGLSVAIMTIYFGVYIYGSSHTNPPSSPIVHQSSGL